MTNPWDLAGYYLGASHGIGQRLGLDRIDRRLASLPLQTTMHVLAQIAFRADQLGPDRHRALEFAQQVFPRSVAATASDRLRRDASSQVTSSQLVLNLANRALVNCADDGSMDPTRCAQELGLLLLALADHIDVRHSDDDTTLEFARLDLFFKLNDLSGWLEVAEDVLFRSLPSLSGDADFFDADQVVGSAFGLSLEEVWALTASFGVVARSDPDGVLAPRPIEHTVLSEEKIEAWRGCWWMDLEEAKRRATRDIASGGWWQFSAFYESPLLGLFSSQGVITRPAFLGQKATPSGMFWLVRHPFVAEGGDHEQWSRLFGKAIEVCGRSVVDTYLRPRSSELFPESRIQAEWGGGPTCDLVVVQREWLGVDFVFRQITQAAAATGGFEDLLRDLRLGAAEKLVQIDRTFERGLLVQRSTPSRLYPVVVVGAPFPTNPVVSRAVAELAESQDLHVIGVDPRCAPPTVMDLSEFMVLCRAANQLRVPATDLLRAWLGSALDRSSFRDWFVTDGPGSSLQRRHSTEDSTWFPHLRTVIYGDS